NSELSTGGRSLRPTFCKIWLKSGLRLGAQALRTNLRRRAVMIAIQRIFCPPDLTTESDEALRYAVALSSVYNAKLFVLYCKETETNHNNNGHNEQSPDTNSLFIASLAPH